MQILLMKPMNKISQIYIPSNESCSCESAFFSAPVVAQYPSVTRLKLYFFEFVYLVQYIADSNPKKESEREKKKPPNTHTERIGLIINV